MQVLERSCPRHPRRDPHRAADPGRAGTAAADRRRVRRRQSHADAAERPRHHLSGGTADSRASSRTRHPTSSSWTMPAASGNRTAAGSAPSSRTWCRAPPETCSPQRSSASNHAASRSSSIATTKSPSRFRSDRSPMRSFWRSCSKLPDWATGLPLGGKVHSGPHYLEAPEHPAEPLVTPDPDEPGARAGDR